GSYVGILFATDGFKQAIAILIQRALYYGLMILLLVFLSSRFTRGTGLGIDVWGVVSDLTVGGVLGFGLGFTLRRGRARTIGFALTTLFVVGVAAEAGLLLRLSAGITPGEGRPKKTRGSTNNRGNDEDNAA